MLTTQALLKCKRCSNTNGAYNRSRAIGCVWSDLGAPLCRHIAAAEGAYTVCKWLIESDADINAMDRFQRTPLEVRGLFCQPCTAVYCQRSMAVYCHMAVCCQPFTAVYCQRFICCQHFTAVHCQSLMDVYCVSVLRLYAPRHHARGHTSWFGGSYAAATTTCTAV